METSQISWIDTHCHLYADEFDPDRHAVLKNTIASGVSAIMLPNIDLESIPGMWDLARKYPAYCKPMMGLHPCSVKEDYREILERMRIELISNPYAGIGETGIDLYWDTTFRKEQIDAFELQIKWAKEFNLPVIIHSRESLDLNIDIISTHQDGRLRGIFHCFSGTVDQVKRIEDVGFKVGIGGIVTYKNSGLTELLPHIPLNMIVLETDSPYLAPVPHRGQRNEPSHLVLVAKRVSEILHLPEVTISEITNENARSVFQNIG